MLKSAIKILTVSEFSKNEIVDYYNISNEKVFVVPNAAGSEFFFKNNLAVTSPKYLLAVSSLCKHKNFEILARVVEKLSIPMKVVGEYGGNFAKPNLGNVGTNIEYLGRVSDKELVDLYRAALAFVFPSVYEGFGIPPIEAQACGCPVLSSNVASLPEVLGNSAHYFDPYSEVEIQKSIELMLSDKKYRARLIRLGFTNSSKYSWVRSAIKIRENIEKI
jgi:glycosyltransferase involved in cell wall biosynthesis